VNQDATANSTGISAQLVRVNTKGVSQYVIEVQGPKGNDQAFTLAIDSSTYLSSQNPPAQPPVLQKDFLAEAADARVMVDGQLITRPTNSITGAISNVTLELNGVTSSPAKISLTRDVQVAKDNINALVSSYNDFVEALKELGNSKSEVETLGGSLAGDGLLQTVRNQIRSALQLSDKDNASVNAISSLGLSVGLDGRMTIKSDRVLTQKLSENFDQVVRLFTSSPASTSKKGLAGDTLAAIDILMPKYGKGRIQNHIDSNTKEVTRYKDQLTQLDARLAKSLERYMTQFSIMQSMVGDSNSVRAGLKNSLGFNSNQ
jgi:flagellar hook-associated protein 2